MLPNAGKKKFETLLRRNIILAPKNFGCSSFKKLMEKLLPALGRYEVGTGANGSPMFLARRKK